MKKITPLLNILLSIMLLQVMVGCQSGSETASQQEEKPNAEVKQADPLSSSVNLLLTQYFSLKDALVETDAAAGQSQATSLVALIESTTDLADKTASLKAASQEIANSDDIEMQRAAFEQVTAEMLSLAKAHKSDDQTVYYQYCPMAFENKGAYWLSNEKKVMNPYFGDRMLHCGKVEESF